jgi:hypothetical protein
MKAWPRAGMALAVGLCALCSGTSWAGLGGGPANLGTVVSQSRADVMSSAGARYTDVQRDLDSGVTVHEYLDADGRVFAVSWAGPYMPNLKEILGAHFSELTAEVAQRKGGDRSRLTVNRSDVVIVSGGHMGAFEGRAWLPSRLPAGLDPRDIK